MMMFDKLLAADTYISLQPTIVFSHSPLYIAFNKTHSLSQTLSEPNSAYSESAVTVIC